MSEGKGNITVNGKDFKEYFPVDTMQFKLEQPFNIADLVGKFDVKANVNGGGTTLGLNDNISASFSRALSESLQYSLTEDEFNAIISNNIKQITEASE